MVLVLNREMGPVLYYNSENLSDIQIVSAIFKRKHKGAFVLREFANGV